MARPTSSIHPTRNPAEIARDALFAAIVGLLILTVRVDFGEERAAAGTSHAAAPAAESPAPPPAPQETVLPAFRWQPGEGCVLEGAPWPPPPPDPRRLS